jgi:hypothetical protein
MKRFTLIVLALASMLLSHRAPAASIYLHTPSISGEDPTPGFPGAMNLRSLTITPDAFLIIKRVDSGSSQLFTAVAGGTPLAATQALPF